MRFENYTPSQKFSLKINLSLYGTDKNWYMENLMSQDKKHLSTKLIAI
ncbi:aminomethyltransferase domain protein [Leptospira interrogans serovar Bataviae str. HAI135]|nr:aminomethyltransferase domain protein [Leptospira interrogans serovar Bataviae str. HAI135]